MTIEPARSSQGGIDLFRKISGGDKHHALVLLETVDELQKGVHDLNPVLIVLPPDRSPVADAVDLVNKQNAGLLRHRVVEAPSHGRKDAVQMSCGEPLGYRRRDDPGIACAGERGRKQSLPAARRPADQDPFVDLRSFDRTMAPAFDVVG